jgi:hypothetical protein
LAEGEGDIVQVQSYFQYDVGAPVVNGEKEQVGIITTTNETECPSEPKMATSIKR